MDDVALLQQFQVDRAEQAFEQLVRRHVDLVYSAALRQVKDPATAEDVTQSVFVLLATKAPTIRAGEALAGWLLVTTRYVAINTLRGESRRRRHELGAAMIKSQDQPNENARAWDTIGPILDDAIAALKRDDRDAVALRFFQGKTAAEMGAAMGISHEAAQKRLSRAVEKLRSFFAARGIQCTPDTLASLLAVNAVGSAPPPLTARISSAALSQSAASPLASEGAIAASATANGKLVVIGIAACLLLAGVAAVAYRQSGRRTNLVPVTTIDESQPEQSLAIPATQPAASLAADISPSIPNDAADDQNPHFYTARAASYTAGPDPHEQRNGHSTLCISSGNQRTFTWCWYGWDVNHTEPFRGHRIRVSAWIKTQDVTGMAHLAVWAQPKVRIDDPQSRTAIKGTNDWKKYELTAYIPPAQEHFSPGLNVTWRGKVWVDELHYELIPDHSAGATSQ